MYRITLMLILLILFGTLLVSTGGYAQPTADTIERALA